MAAAGRPKTGVGAKAWLMAARPKTLTAGATPVIVGSAIAFAEGSFRPWRAAAAMAVAISIQIGTNLTNDAMDARKGADERRIGPPRAVAAGLLSFRAVAAAGLGCFAVAGLVGLWLASVSSWWVLVPGGVAILAGAAYTTGPAPLAYLGLGEIFVFAFFGLFATAGTTFVQSGNLPAGSWLAGAALGLLAVAILEVNNIRDAPTDLPAGKRTLAVRIGDARARRLYIAAVAIAYVLASSIAFYRIGACAVLLTLPFAIGPAGRIRRGVAGRDLNRELAETARMELFFGLMLAAGIVISR